MAYLQISYIYIMEAAAAILISTASKKNIRLANQTELVIHSGEKVLIDFSNLPEPLHTLASIKEWKGGEWISNAPSKKLYKEIAKNDYQFTIAPKESVKLQFSMSPENKYSANPTTILKIFVITA